MYIYFGVIRKLQNYKICKLDFTTLYIVKKELDIFSIFLLKNADVCTFVWIDFKSNVSAKIRFEMSIGFGKIYKTWLLWKITKDLSLCHKL